MGSASLILPASLPAEAHCSRSCSVRRPELTKRCPQWQHTERVSRSACTQPPATAARRSRTAGASSGCCLWWLPDAAACDGTMYDAACSASLASADPAEIEASSATWRGDRSLAASPPLPRQSGEGRVPTATLAPCPPLPSPPRPSPRPLPPPPLVTPLLVPELLECVRCRLRGGSLLAPRTRLKRPLT